MRTKALVLAAAFAAAGVATSVAQVYSVNAVGYVNVSLAATGFSMVSNPLDAGTGNNTVAKLFANIQGGVPSGLKVFTFDEAGGQFRAAAVYVPGPGFIPPASASVEVPPGSGAFVFNPGPAATLTFVGQVMQGNLSNPIPVGFSIKANQVPQAGKPNTFGLPGAQGDKLFKFDKTTGAYGTPANYITGPGWLGMPDIAVGEAFFLFRASANGATTWTRTFNVNNPS